MNHFSGSLFWRHSSNVLLWSDPAFNEGLCRNSKPHPTATESNTPSSSARDSDFSHHVPHYDVWWELNTVFIVSAHITKSCAAKVESSTLLWMSLYAIFLFCHLKKENEKHVLQYSMPNLTKTVRKCTVLLLQDYVHLLKLHCAC